MWATAVFMNDLWYVGIGLWAFLTKVTSMGGKSFGTIARKSRSSFVRYIIILKKGKIIQLDTSLCTKSERLLL